MAALTGLCALLATGCGGLRTAKAPMDRYADPSSCPGDTRTLLVMLPGAYSDPDEFVREGFVEAVRARKLAVDVVRVDAHLGYYNHKTILERLDRDVIAPARAKGYRAVWLLGISVGGFGSLLYAQTRPGEIAGLVVLAPYLGERAQSMDIANAGGLARWQGPLEAPPGSDPRTPNEAQLWQWLRGYAGAAGDRPPLYLGYGLGDRFAFSHRLLAAALPAGRVFTTQGGHDWPEWKRLWEDILPRLPLPVCAG
jgi:pimeloyl-ACP methyl ester carboxylesterase